MNYISEYDSTLGYDEPVESAMQKRSYGQYCPLAFALDVVGERWTMLLVRELMFGPRRFTDLLNALPGIGTNLLSKRLRDLEIAAVVAKRELPPPASSSVYELAERGRGLLPVLAALAEWGTALLPTTLQGDFLGVVPTMAYMQAYFRPERAADLETSCELRAGGEVFHVKVRAGAVEVAAGELNNAALICEGATTSLVAMLGRPAVAVEEVRSGSVTLHRGALPALQQLV